MTSRSLGAIMKRLDRVTPLQAAAINNLDSFMWAEANPYMRHYDRNAPLRRALAAEPLSQTTNISDCWDNCGRNQFSNENCFVQCQRMAEPAIRAEFSPKLTYYIPGTR